MNKLEMIINEKGIDLYVDESITETEMIYAIFAMQDAFKKKFGYKETEEES